MGVELTRGTMLQDKYEVGELLGQGGTGRVYAAYDLHLRQTVAVKQISRGELAGIKADSLWNEVAVLKQTEHPALPKIYDYFNEGNHDYMVLEYIRGITLAEYIRENGPFGQGAAVTVMKKLLAVFGYLHSFSPPIIYRDLKPANIMLKEDGQIKLIDFGTAYHRQPGPEIPAGTPGFSAPELLMPEKANGEWQESSDIYSLGAIFAYMLTGREIREPFRSGFHRRPVRKYNRAVSDGIEKIIIKCLQEKTEKRYSNVKQLKQDVYHYRRLERGRAIKRTVGRLISLFLLISGLLLIVAETRAGVTLPFSVNNGYLEWPAGYRLPPSLAAGLIIFLTGAYGCLLSGHRKKRSIKPEKNIYLTEKKTIGLWGSSLLIGCLLTALLCRGEAAYAEDITAARNITYAGDAAAAGNATYAEDAADAGNTAYAEDATCTDDDISDNLRHLIPSGQEQPFFTGEIVDLPVTVRDPSGYKLLIRYGAVYRPSQDMILELPLSGLPQDEEVILQVTVTGVEKKYQSREFIVRVEK